MVTLRDNPELDLLAVLHLDNQFKGQYSLLLQYEIVEKLVTYTFSLSGLILKLL